MERDVLFISKATPEDDEFVLWLAPRLEATRALDALEGKGLIVRRSLERDGREQEIQPTCDALAIKSALNEASGTITGRLKRLLGSGEFTDAVTKMRRIRSVLK
jgi:MarR family transcriptional regulator, temperature-dependent positive regulator of motility